MKSSWCRRATHHHDKSFDINDDSLPPTRRKTSINMCLSTWIEREDVKELWIALPLSEFVLFYYIFSLMTSRKLNSMVPGRTPCGSFAEEASRSVALIEKVWFRKENTEMCYQHWRCSCDFKLVIYYDDVRMGAIASQITSLTIVYSIVYSDADQRKHQSSASLAFVRGIHRGPVNSPHKWPVTRKMFPFDDVIMSQTNVTDIYFWAFPLVNLPWGECHKNSIFCPDLVFYQHWLGNGLVPSGSKPLPEPMLTQINVAIWGH